MSELINSLPDFSDCFSDKRIGKRANQVLQKLNLGRTSSLRRISQSDAEQKSFYRLFNNESFTEEGITKAIINRCSALCSGRHVLAIQDTTEFNFSSHKGRKAAHIVESEADLRGLLGKSHHPLIRRRFRFLLLLKTTSALSRAKAGRKLGLEPKGSEAV